MRPFLSYTLFILIISLFSCGSTNKPVESNTTPAEPEVTVPEFDADSAYAYIEKQLSFGPRVPGSEAHSNCAAWLKTTMIRYADTVQVQAFRARAYDGQVLRGKNIIASFNTENKKRVMLSAHWDSRPFADHDPDESKHNMPIDGANDGASGVGVLIEAARQFSMENPAIGIDIIFFDLEDYGPPQDAQNYAGEDNWGLGSQYWANNPHKSNYRARYGILLDMVGVKDATFLMEGFSMMYAPSRVKKVWDIAEDLGYKKYFPGERGSYITDDHYYLNKIANIPTINIIHLDPESANGSFFEHWHTVSDNLESIDINTLKVVGTVVLNVVYREKG
ncbi:MAG: M28 family peptidase [Bacteroidales bacterium]|nr:M28 family peptidase [Bacteroidales bacterium]